MQRNPAAYIDPIHAIRYNSNRRCFRLHNTAALLGLRFFFRIVRQNIVFSLGVKLICLILGAVGYADMWLAIFADVGVMVIAVLNAIRISWTRM